MFLHFHTNSEMHQYGEFYIFADSKLHILVQDVL